VYISFINYVDQSKKNGISVLSIKAFKS